jgi:hypothetical protein
MARLLLPESEALGDAREVAIAASTLERWTAAARFDAVLTMAVMDEAAKSAWCRANGLFPLPDSPMPGWLAR